MNDPPLVAADSRHLRFITAAQAETARISFRRPLAANERSALRDRLLAALSDPGSRVLVLDGPGGPEGYVWVEGRPGGQAFLLDIFVERTARRKGIGRMLLCQALESARDLGGTQLRLAVSISNRRAKTFFLSEGFQETDREIREGITWFEMGRSTLRPATT